MMDASAEHYNVYNDTAVKNARLLIDKIQSIEKQKRTFDLVVDVGSGSGNVTKQFAETLAINQTIGLDVDQQMVEFARRNNSSSLKTIDYLQCDLQTPWEQLNESVKQLSGRCSMMFSCNALNWMHEVGNVCKNISNLMQPNSRLFVQMADPSRFFPPNDDKADDFYSILPSFKGDRFMNNWKNGFNGNGIQIEECEAYELEYVFTIDALINFWRPIGVSMLKKHLPKDVDYDEFLKTFPEVFQLMDDHSNFAATGRLSSDGQELFSIKSNYWCIVAKKEA